MTKSDYAIDFQNVELMFADGSIGVRDLSFGVRAGQVYCILGPNGAGKTTTLKIILGLLRPSKGCVRICSEDISSQMARASTAYVPEQVALYGDLTGRENLEYFLRLSGQAKQSDAIYRALLDSVRVPSHAYRKQLKHFSKGVRQKVALAIAIGKNSRVLLLDEPMSGLDPSSSRELLDILNKQRSIGKTILMVTHDLTSVADLADVIGFMYEGFLATEVDRSSLGDTPVSRLSELFENVTRHDHAQVFNGAPSIVKDGEDCGFEFSPSPKQGRH